MKFLTLSIVYEDEDILIIDKPAGTIVNDAESVPDEEHTIQEWFLENYGDLYASASETRETWESLVPDEFSDEYGTPLEIFAQRKGLTHRLDKETSGALVLAKNPGAMVMMLKQFRERTVQKTYRCLTHGKFSIESDTLRMPLGRDPRDRRRFDVRPTGRTAETSYEVEQYWPHLDEAAVRSWWKSRGQKVPISNFRKRKKIYQGFSLVTCFPKTGRTHQIRVHMSAVDHPLVGDSTYAGHKRTQVDAVWCPRQFLHAAKIEFTHPRSGEMLTVEVPFSPDLERAVSFLTQEPQP